MKIAITNAVLSNTGDAAILQAILTSLEEADSGALSDVVVFDVNARVTSALYPRWRIVQQLTASPPRRISRIRTFLQKRRLAIVRLVAAHPRRAARLLNTWPVRVTRFATAYRELTSADVVISSGGTYLVDHYNFAPRVLELELAKQHGARVVLWTQSLGPFRSERARTAAGRIAEVVDAVYFRDEKSARAWTTVSQRPSVQSVIPDSVFTLTAPASGRQFAAPGRALISVRKWSVGIEKDHVSTDAYSSMLRAGAEHLIADGWQVDALSTCQGVPSYAFDDSEVARSIFAELPVTIQREFHTPDQLLDELTETDLVITTRMHLAILALLSRRPVIAIAYEFKTLELFHSLGLDEFVIAMEDADPAWMTRTLETIAKDPLRAVLSPAHLRQLREDALRPARELHSTLGHGVRTG